jgi:hypothetical protein
MISLSIDASVSRSGRSLNAYMKLIRLISTKSYSPIPLSSSILSQVPVLAYTHMPEAWIQAFTSSRIICARSVGSSISAYTAGSSHQPSSPSSTSSGWVDAISTAVRRSNAWRRSSSKPSIAARVHSCSHG